MCCHFNQIPPNTLNVLMSMLLLHDLLQRMVCACAIIKVCLGHMNMIIQFSYPCYKFLKKKNFASIYTHYIFPVSDILFNL